LELLDTRPFMGGQIVHDDDDISRRERWGETLFHPFLEESAVDGPVEDLPRFMPAQAQAGDKSNRLVMAVRNGGAQPSSPPATSAFAREIGGGAGLVNENELPWIEIGLARKPCEATLQGKRRLPPITVEVGEPLAIFCDKALQTFGAKLCKRFVRRADA